MSQKQRLDALLVERGLFASRQQAQRAIQAGWVRVNHQVIDKPGTPVPAEVDLEIHQKQPYVSRGGEKLAKALAAFGVTPAGRVCLDGGISTGGFTDCLLQAGATRVYGIDVGYGQVAWSLRQDDRVVLRERTNLRHLTPAALYSPTDPWPSLGVVDVSFISLAQVLPALWTLLAPPRELIALVKPQFEAGREAVGKGGVVRDLQQQALVLQKVMAAATTLGWGYGGLTWSPCLGPAGNIEYLLWLVTTDPQTFPESSDLAALTQAAGRALRDASSGRE
ncbi:MAG: TlyA family RNA methyltransferase [Gloeomargaritaceae cyanobacterium C42_A2020_066]|nr:TlyA family RNA methyltransferase [Gloeomargaritaceae cyanobacterium C42_A2020_066]